MMGVDADYITPPPKGGTPELENLWTLCYDCHRSVGHGTPPKSNRYRRFGAIALFIIWAIISFVLAGIASLTSSLSFVTTYLIFGSPLVLIAWSYKRNFMS